MSSTATRFTLVWLFSFGCAATPSGGGETGESSSSSGSMGTSTDSTSTGDSEESADSEQSEASTTGPAPDFLLPECDILAQDCDEGDKCVPDEDRTVCVPIDDNAVALERHSS